MKTPLLGALLLFHAAIAGAATYTFQDLGSVAASTLPGNIEMNNSGQIAFNRVVSGNNHAFLYSGGVATDLGTLGGATSSAEGINDSGVVVGSSLNGSGFDRAFRRVPGGSLQDIGTLGGNYSYGFGINAAGLIVGSSDPSGGQFTAFVLPLVGSMSSLGNLGGIQSQAFAINSSNVIVGSSDDGNGKRQAFLYADHGPMVGLGFLAGYASSTATAINDAGHVVGYASTLFNTRAFSYVTLPIKDMGTLGGATSAALDNDNADQIVGTSATASSAAHAFLFENGAMKDLNGLVTGLGANVLDAAYAINERGQIAGTFSGGTRLFLLTPVPEPSVTVSGKKKITTTAQTVLLKGTASDSHGTLARVEVKVGKSAYKRAKGLSKWKFTAKIKAGKTVILVRSVDAGGATSPSAKVTVIRK